jgi:hypothetical protein
VRLTHHESNGLPVGLVQGEKIRIVVTQNEVIIVVECWVLRRNGDGSWTSLSRVNVRLLSPDKSSEAA